MQKKLIWAIVISGILYFLSSFAFPLLGERIVAPIQIVCLIIGLLSFFGAYICFYKAETKKIELDVL